MNRRIIQVKQNTKEWSAWRSRGIGASDAPIIMGDSPWTTKFELWGYKTGILKRDAPNSYQLAAMNRGSMLEPEARRLYETDVGAKFPATSFEHPVHTFLRASLDGFNAQLNKNLEIKCPGKADHAIALSGTVPRKYMPQVQMQMLVSGAESSDYFSWDGGSSCVTITIQPDLQYQDRLLYEMVVFWNLVQARTPPSTSREEFMKLAEITQKELDKTQRLINTLSLMSDNIKESK